MADKSEMPTVDNKKRIFLLGILLTVFITPYIIQESARGHESWGAWFFARLFWETGTFPAMGRSPVYALLTSVFWPLGYPYGPAAMRVIDALFLFSGMFVFFRCYLRFWMAVVAALVWLPGLLAIEGIVISYAVASLCWALAFRQGPVTRSRRVISYAFLILCFMLRINYIVVLVGFIIYDAWQYLLLDRKKLKLSSVKPSPHDWPVVLLLGLCVIFSAVQSDHRWNNALYTDVDWLGPDQRSLSSAAQIGSFTHWIIVNKYDSNFDDHDIYFISRDDLPEFKSILDIFKYPEILFGQIYSNKQMISIIARITDLGDALFKNAARLGSHIISYPIFYALFIYGLYRFCNQCIAVEQRRSFFELLAAVGVITAPLFIAWPSGTYYFHFVPLFVFSAVGIAHFLSEWIGRFMRCNPFLAAVIALTSMLFFSNGFSRSAQTFAGAGSLEAWQRPHLVNEIFAGSFEDIDALTTNCRGTLLTNDHTAMAAFSKQPVEKFYSIFEIPPFGHYGSSVYDGLNPNRIDCIFVNKSEVKRGGRTFTTTWSRYENYLVPYIENLKMMGARTYSFGTYGKLELTILHPIR